MLEQQTYDLSAVLNWCTYCFTCTDTALKRQRRHLVAKHCQCRVCPFAACMNLRFLIWVMCINVQELCINFGILAALSFRCQRNKPSACW